MKFSAKFGITVAILAIASIATILAFRVLTDPLSPEFELQTGEESPAEPTSPAVSNWNDTTPTDKPALTTEIQKPASTVRTKNLSESEAMISWKQSAGITTTANIEFYYKKPREELQKLAQQGDLEAKNWLGIDLARSGDQEAAIGILKDAVTDGSIGAARTLAEMYSGTTTQNFTSDKIQSYAWYRLAQAMGDSGPMLLGQIPRNFSSEEQYIAELAYFDLLSEVHAAYELKHGQPMPFNPPPIESKEGN